MLDNLIRGGQLFLHNIAMFKQVIGKSFSISLLITSIIVTYIFWEESASLDFHAGTTYVKAKATQWMYDHRLVLHKNSNKVAPRIDAYDKKGLYMPSAYTKNIIKHPKFKKAYGDIKSLVLETLKLTVFLISGLVTLIFIVWIRYGKSAKETKMLDGSNILTPKEVTKYLKQNKKASSITIDSMPLVKDQETRHILVTGMTGSGKTNLINKILPQVRSLNQPAIVIDQTGEMIARYYDPSRGDVIFNPLDERSKSWDFWADCTSSTNEFGTDQALEKFAKVLFGGSKNPSHTSDPFWSNSAEAIFCSCVEYLLKTDNRSIKELNLMLRHLTAKELRDKLVGTKAERYLAKENSSTAASILTVMSTSTQPLSYLNEIAGKKKFSIKRYFKAVDEGSQAWLFFAAPPSQREVIMPLIASMMELAVSFLVGSGIKESRRVWFIVDELAALGHSSSFNTLMTEGRKYGGCVLASLQSYNQLLSNYGQHMGSTIFGQFATKFIFRCNEPNLAKLMSDMFGSIEYSKQQKNTSYGAHEHRDGISYTEQEKKKPLLAINKFIELNDLECFVGLPDPKIKLTRLQLKPVKNVPIVHQGFIELKKITQVPAAHQAGDADKAIISNDVPQNLLVSDKAPSEPLAKASGALPSNTFNSSASHTGQPLENSLKHSSGKVSNDHVTDEALWGFKVVGNAEDAKEPQEGVGKQDKENEALEGNCLILAEGKTVVVNKEDNTDVSSKTEKINKTDIDIKIKEKQLSDMRTKALEENEVIAIDLNLK